MGVPSVGSWVTYGLGTKNRNLPGFVVVLDQEGGLNQNFNEKYPGISELSARIASYELAYRMQACAPEAVDLSNENEAAKKIYGLDDPATTGYGRQCLLARRLVERGVRFVQLISGAYVSIEDTWDAHAKHRE